MKLYKAEYIWIDGTEPTAKLRSKTKILGDDAKGAELPVVEAALREYAQLIAAGHGDEDVSALFRLKAALFAVPKPDPP